MLFQQGSKSLSPNFKVGYNLRTYNFWESCLDEFAEYFNFENVSLSEWEPSYTPKDVGLLCTDMLADRFEYFNGLDD